jgi:drug/metabolite transporter (DMT)-like permease
MLALSGVFIITFQPGDYLRLGSLMIVGSTFMYALHAALVKRYGGDMDFLSFFFFRLLFTTAFLLLFAVGGRALTWPTPTAWLILLLAGTLDVTVSRGLYYAALRRLPITLFAIIMTLSPVIAIGWSLLLFDTFPSPIQLLGGLTVLCGVLLATFPQQQRMPRMTK